MTLPQKNGHRIKTPSSKLTILVSSCWEKNFVRNNAHNFSLLSLIFLKLLIVSVAFFLGHPVYRILNHSCSALWYQHFMKYETYNPMNIPFCRTASHEKRLCSFLYSVSSWPNKREEKFDIQLYFLFFLHYRHFVSVSNIFGSRATPHWGQFPTGYK